MGCLKRVGIVVAALLHVVFQQVTALTAEELSRNQFLEVFEDAVLVTANARDQGATATCPGSSKIVLGWAYHYRGDDNSQGPSCIRENNKHCVIGASSCSTVPCDGPGRDEMGVRILCSTKTVANLEAVSLSTESGSGQQTISCPANKGIVYMFSYQFSSDMWYDSEYLNDCVDWNHGNSGTFINYPGRPPRTLIGDTSSTTHHCSAPNTILFRYLLCADLSFANRLYHDGAYMTDIFDYWFTARGNNPPPPTDVRCTNSAPTSPFGVLVGTSQNFDSSHSEMIRSENTFCTHRTNKQSCRQEYYSVGTHAVQFASLLCMRAKVATNAPTKQPTKAPTTKSPTKSPTRKPTSSPIPLGAPTASPIIPPTTSPTALPTVSPTSAPSTVPTAAPISQRVDNPDSPGNGKEDITRKITRDSSSLDVLFVGIGVSALVSTGIGAYLVYSGKEASRRKSSGDGPGHGTPLIKSSDSSFLSQKSDKDDPKPSRFNVFARLRNGGKQGGTTDLSTFVTNTAGTPQQPRLRGGSSFASVSHGGSFSSIASSGVTGASSSVVERGAGKVLILPSNERSAEGRPSRSESSTGRPSNGSVSSTKPSHYVRRKPGSMSSFSSMSSSMSTKTSTGKLRTTRKFIPRDEVVSIAPDMI